MNIRNVVILSTVVATSVFLAGCASPNNKTTLDVSSMLNANCSTGPGPARSLNEQFDASVWAGLEKAKNPAVAGERSLTVGLPSALANSPLITKLIAANQGVVDTATAPRSLGSKTKAPTPVSFSSSDFKDFINNTIPAVGISAWNPPQGSDGRALPVEAVNPVEKYLIIYYQGNFVDRSGNAISKPTITGGKIGDDTINGLATVILEAINDTFYSVPVFYEVKDGKQTWLTPTGKEPTYATLSINSTNTSADNNFGYDSKEVVAISTNAAPGVPNDTEVSAIQFLADVASDQSKALSGLVFKSLGGATASFVIGGKLSIGDNNTLSGLVDTFFSDNSYRTTEALTYAYFKNHSQQDSGPGLQQLLSALQQINTLYKDYSQTNSTSGSGK